MSSMLCKLPNKKVLVFKSEETLNKDPYQERLSCAGFETIVLPVIRFEYMNLKYLEGKLKSPEDYSGIIFTSERCVEGTKLALGDDCLSVMALWKDHKVLCTGPATLSRVKNSLGLEGQVPKDKQRAEGIIELLSQEKKPSKKPLLYPCGELAAKKDTFRSVLLEKGIFCDDTVIYSTIPNTHLGRPVIRCYSGDEKDWPRILVFFSPSGVQEAMKCFEVLQEVDLQKLFFVAFGPTTAAEIRKFGLTVWAQSEKPNPESLCDAILKALSDHQQ